MRVCFDVEEIDEGGGATPCVAKFFKKDIPDVVDIDYFNEAMAQCLSEEFAQNFNRSVPAGNARISFLACHVVRIKKEHAPPINVAAMHGRNSFFTFKTKDTHDTLFVMEFKFRGKFTKYNNNYGEVYEEGTAKESLSPQEKESRRKLFLAAEAFSHFTLTETGGTMLVCDLQGVNDFFTDPQIHTEDGKGLGMGNMAQKGIDKWVENHKCNEICVAMRLARLTLGAPPVHMPSQEIIQQAAVSSWPGGGGSAGHYHSMRDAMASATSLRGVQQPPGGPRVFNGSQQPTAAAGVASPGPGVTSSPKQISEMTEEEQMELAIMRSLQSR
jgi:hypothetical protein